MDQDLREARLARALRTIEQFGPTPEPSPRPTMGRLELLRWVLDNRQELRKATKQELVEVIAIIEQCKTRS